MLSFTGDDLSDQFFSFQSGDANSSWNLTIDNIYRIVAKANLSNPRILEELFSQLRLIQEDSGEVYPLKDMVQNAEKGVLVSKDLWAKSIAEEEEVEEVIQLIKKANYAALYKSSEVPSLRARILGSLLTLKMRKQPKSLSVGNSITNYLTLISLFKAYFSNTVPSNIRNELVLLAEIILNQLYQHQVTQSDTRLREQVLDALSMASELCDFIKNQPEVWRTSDFFRQIKNLAHELDQTCELLSV
jgi:hypothetical protein